MEDQAVTECGLHGDLAAAHAKENRQDIKYIHVVLHQTTKKEFVAKEDHGENTQAGPNALPAVSEAFNTDRDTTAATPRKKVVLIGMNVFAVTHQATDHGATGDLARFLAAKVYKRDQQSEFAEMLKNMSNVHAELNNAANCCLGVHGVHAVPPVSTVFKKELELRLAPTAFPLALNTETAAEEMVCTTCGHHGHHVKSFAESKPSKLAEEHTHV